jgi:hypothetical protein
VPRSLRQEPKGISNQPRHPNCDECRNENHGAQITSKEKELWDRTLGAHCGSSTSRRHGQAAPKAGPASGDPAEVMRADLTNGVSRAEVSMAEALAKPFQRLKPTATRGQWRQPNMAPAPLGGSTSGPKAGHASGAAPPGSTRAGRAGRAAGKRLALGLGQARLTRRRARTADPSAWWTCKAASCTTLNTECKAETPSFHRERRATSSWEGRSPGDRAKGLLGRGLGFWSSGP